MPAHQWTEIINDSGCDVGRDGARMSHRRRGLCRKYPVIFLMLKLSLCLTLSAVYTFKVDWQVVGVFFGGLCLKNVIKCPGLLSYWTFQEGLRQTTIFMINLLVVPEAHGVTSSDFLFLLKWVQNPKMFNTKETKKYTCLRSWKPDYFCQSFLKTWLIDYQTVAD